MIVAFTDAETATTVYVNPAYVMTMRPDPADPDHRTIVRLEDGESIRVNEDHRKAFDKLARAA
jgi:hypothetical protein